MPRPFAKNITSFINTSIWTSISKSAKKNFEMTSIRYFAATVSLTNLQSRVISNDLRRQYYARNLLGAQFYTGDGELDRMLETARCKFINPDEAIRREALESLWDAWERLKTLGDGSNKKAQVTYLLDHTAGLSSPKFRAALEREAKELTGIGNNFRNTSFRKKPRTTRQK